MPPSSFSTQHQDEQTLHSTAYDFLNHLDLFEDYPYPLPSKDAINEIAPKKRMWDYLKSSTPDLSSSSSSGGLAAVAALSSNAVLQQHSRGSDGNISSLMNASTKALSSSPGSDDVVMELSTWSEVAEPIIPCLSALVRLTYVIFAPVTTTLVICYLLGSLINNSKSKEGEKQKSVGVVTLMVSLTGVLSSFAMMTDEMYILEYSRPPLVGLFLVLVSCFAWYFSLYLSSLRCSSAAKSLPSLKKTSSRSGVTYAMALAALGILMPVLFRTEESVGSGYASSSLWSGAPAAGLYYDKSKRVSAGIVANWPEETRVYDDGRGTPWALTGDTRTLVPFFAYKLSDYPYIRRWLPVSDHPNETEAIALDIGFPPDGKHRISKPIYFVLHGVTGGSQDEFVKDFCYRETQNNHTVIVMITRGLMQTPIKNGESLFHFGRISDVTTAATAVKRAMSRMTSGENQKLIGVGFSMGGQTVANYVARSGKKCQLDAAIVFSAGVYSHIQLSYQRSTSLWQPFLVKSMRDIILGFGVDKLRAKLTASQVWSLSRAANWYEMDKFYFAPQAGHDNVERYLDEVSPNTDALLSNISIPLCVVMALDDPIAYWKIIGDDPQSVVESLDKSDLMILVTKRGGHVGWPLGMHPSLNGYRWMSDVTSSFVSAVESVVQS
mmetsp:Transcript_31647/g.38752  ORF Transcript_31647/g.38752 Transcript_31647/m.38752 type:complete len:664 (-) Transcript_31647:222-2213(-)|eukprot:CAMPEP_0172509068 /NCGR_PEP_ID=MMETSP1066-20121228/217332_1 /TAXON_ID=671091 /ORGANISM="Coscinodiscus wailesii, Strain CCMP2513" /LENGTH=663 /DNA_ID=CAMNT_0013287385 /DNA_START=72 /DNA_END=2063 /DNA_ORIENTATION=-